MSEPMPQSPRLGSLRAIVRRELRDLITVKRSDRPWELPFAVAMAVGLPMVIGAWLGELREAALASIGAMTMIYIPRTRLDHRMVTLMAAAFGMTACYALGQLTHLVPEARLPVIALVAVLVTMACRYYRVGPPGPLFFVMATTIGAYTPGDLAGVAAKLGLFTLGTMGAVLIGFVYSLHILRFRAPVPVLRRPTDLLDSVLIEALIIGLFVALSLGAAQFLGIEKPYWAPVSCLAVIQGVNLRAVWNRKIQRIVGTMIGLGLTWLLVRYAADPWAVAITVTLLTFLIETAIVRHYAFAAIFITPVAILLAEASTLGLANSSGLITARLADTVVGALIGLAGGACLHSPALRQRLKRWLSAAGAQ
ncbi:MAG TPA: FUSC family protein [Sphingobium sp.]|nr:FUSC family protein [Sphingobium sp.]